MNKRIGACSTCGSNMVTCKCHKLFEDFKILCPTRENTEGIRLKYLQLGREIEALTNSSEKSNLQHTHSKLGIFLEEFLGVDIWRGK